MTIKLIMRLQVTLVLELLHRSDHHRVSEPVLSTMVQSWPRTQIAFQKKNYGATVKCTKLDPMSKHMSMPPPSML